MDNNQQNNEGRGSDGRSGSSTDGSSNSDQNSNSNTTSTNSESNPNRSHRTHLNLFDRFMDNLLDRSHRNSTTRSTTATDTPYPGANPTNTSSTTNTSNTSPESDDSRSIVITVNYVFSDENNPRFPNRAGSLILSLPNNSSNRDPRAIQEFIRLATQMAYSSIINGLHKEKGITVDKFNSFPTVIDFSNGNDETNRKHDQTCSICFEDFDNINKELSKIEDDEVVDVKKRKLHDGTDNSTATDSRSNSRNGNSSQVPSRPQTPVPEQESHPSQSSQPQYLCDYVGQFDHSAIKMPCGHIFGKECLSEWLKGHTTCPLCRSSVADEQQQQDSFGNNFTVFNIPLNRDDEETGTPAATATATSTSTSTTTSSSTVPLAPSSASIPAPIPEPTPTASATSPGATASGDRFHYFGISNSDTDSTNRQREGRPSIFERARQTRSHRRSPSRSSPSTSASQSTSSGSSLGQPLANLLRCLRRPRSNNSQTVPEPLFPTGIASRRTANGIETFPSDSSEDIADFLNLTSMINNSNDDNDNNNNNNHNNNGTMDNETNGDTESSH
ncbi:uncharacterized protein RJT21DRAFT_120242 [Scheffersomyces amazonensis]|uniref:uncharacterized protein n=1 Tax=Scheffersomyces amazonensis TaxID=1078765 RepID=UPI00315D099A